MKFYETKQFKELEQEWEQKLEATGFEDIEKKVGACRELKQFSSNWFRQAKEIVREMRARYFEKVSECFHQEIFLEHRIMQDYAGGKKMIKIHAELSAEGFEIEYETIRYIIRRYEYKWGLKIYSAKQMNLKKLPIRS